MLQGHSFFNHGLGVVDPHAYLDADVAAANVHNVAARYLVQVSGEAAVGGGERQVRPHETVPKAHPVFFVLQRGIGVILHPVRFSVPVAIEGEGQCQYLAVHRHTPAAGLGYYVKPVLGRYVDEVHPCAGPFRQTHHGAKRQVLHRLGVDEVYVVPVPMAPLLGQQVVVHHQLVVLSVHRQHAVVFGDLLHHLLQPP